MADIASGPDTNRHGPLAGSAGQARLALPVLLYILAVVTPVLMQAGPLHLSLIRIVLLIMIIPLTLRLFSGRYGKVLFVDYMFFAHIGWMTIAMSVTNPDRVVQNTGSAAVEFLGAYVLGRAYIQNRGDFIALIKLVSFLALLTVPLAILEAKTGQPLVLNLIKKLPGIHTYANVNNEPRMGLERAQTLFIHPIHYGLFCSMSFALVYVGLGTVMTKGTRVFYGAAISLCVFLSLSSGALLALLLQMFLIGWAAALDKQKRRWLILLGLFVFIYVVIDLLSNRTPIRVFMTYATFSAHNAFWRSIIFEWGVMNIMGSVAEGIPSARLFGIGLSDWVRPHFMHSGSMDNFWLVVGVRHGLPGLFFLAAGYLWLLWKVGTRDLGNDQRLLDLRRAWVIAFVGMTFTLATVHIWAAVFSFVMFMFGAGVWFLSAEPDDGGNGDPRDPAPGPGARASRGTAPDTRRRPAYTRFPDGATATARSPARAVLRRGASDRAGPVR